MDKTSIFSKTAKGITVLGERRSALSREQLRILSMVDGHSTLAEMTEGSGFDQEIVEQVFSDLLAEGLVKQVITSSLLNGVQAPDEMMISVTELDPEEGVRAWAEAQRGMRGLQDQGFYSSSVRPLAGKLPPRILSVEDDPIMAQLLKVLLQREGFLVRHAADGATAHKMLEEDIPDLVLLDVMLPDTSGFRILEWIRKQPKMANLPAIMLTAKVSEEDVMHGMRAGADGYIFKPFTPEPLLQCIRNVLKL